MQGSAKEDFKNEATSHKHNMPEAEDSSSGRWGLRELKIQALRNSLKEERPVSWVAAKELKLNYQNSETILFTMYPQYGTSFGQPALYLLLSGPPQAPKP